MQSTKLNHVVTCIVRIKYWKTQFEMQRKGKNDVVSLLAHDQFLVDRIYERIV